MGWLKDIFTPGSEESKQAAAGLSAAEAAYSAWVGDDDEPLPAPKAEGMPEWVVPAAIAGLAVAVVLMASK